ncbi:MAG: hypothetical protein K6L76_02500 [Agarilytica sp.]
MCSIKEKTVSEIMLNFASALDSIWPHTSSIGLVCYDPWEEFNDSLFHHLVVESLAYKYELPVEKVGLVSLAYPWKNKSEIRALHKDESFEFRQFGYPGVDLSGDENQYFGKGAALNKVSDMRFSHALCEGSRGMEWFERDVLDYEYVQKA